MPRLFVAIDLPDEIRQRLARLQNGLPGARWVEPENLHLTLRFIGEVDNAEAEDIHSALVAVDGAPFAVALAAPGAFPPRGAPHTLWVGVAANPALHQIKGRIDSALARAGCGPDDRKFMPHVTLARLKSAAPARVASFIARTTPLVWGAFEAQAFILYSSFLARSGAIHTPEAVYPLSPG